MPSIQDLERFRTSFRAVGGEAAVLAGRGEAYDELPLPEPGMDAELAGMLAAGPGGDGAESAGAEAPSDDFSFGDFLDGIPDDLGAPLEQASPPSSADDDFLTPEALLDGFADEIETGSDAPPASGASSGTTPEAAWPSSPDEEFDLEMPGPLGDFLEAAAEDDGQPEEAGLPEGAGQPEEAGGSEPADAMAEAGAEVEVPGSNLDDFGDFSIPDFDFPSSAAQDGSAEGAGLEASEELEPDSALGDLSEASEEPSIRADGPAGEDEAFSLFSEEVPEPAPTPAGGGAPSGPEEEPEEFDFSIPEFFEGGLPAEPATVPSGGSGEADDGGLPSFGPPAGEAEDVSLDSFDTFSLGDDFLSSGFGLQKPAEAGAPEEGFARLEDFSLEGIDDIFKGGSQPPPPVVPARLARARRAPEVEEIELSEADFERLQATLAGYPLNLRIACEELIAERVVEPADMSALVKALVRGAGAKEMATLAGRLLGRPIPVPRGFEKRTGEELEAERSTFAYAFKRNILPVLRVFALVATLAACAVYLGYEFGYKPLRAESLYAQGYARIPAGDYARANERFDRASDYRRSKRWYYKYAEAFADARQYALAERKYDELLTYYRRDKKGVLDYAALETYRLRNFEKADRILRAQILDHDLDDEQALLAQGDNYLEWGEIDPARYEDARASFARLMGARGRKDPYLERMMLYFIRTDQLAEVLPLQEHFMEGSRTKASGSSLAELAGYLLDKKEQEPDGVPDPSVARIENLRKLLNRAVELDPAEPEGYYHLARYLERYGNPAEERAAVEAALSAFKASPEKSARRSGYRVDAHRRYASLLARSGEFLPAEEQLASGIRLYEDALARRVLARDPRYGRLYADLGDIQYFKAGDLEASLRYYEEAGRNGWSPPEILYRMGFVDYSRGQAGAAVERFFDAASGFPRNRRMLLALGNALYARGDLRAAQGYYERLVEMLEAERARFPVLLPNERPEHAELAERLMRARNNLGAALESLAERTGDAALRTRALALYSESARAWDALTRDPESMVRSGSVNLAFLNTRGALYPVRDLAPQIYATIDKDVLEPSEWEDLIDRE